MIKTYLKRWLFSEEIKELEKTLKRLERQITANEFLIDQGRRSCQYQINNYRHTNKMPFTLMGHGLQTAANSLGVTDQQWRRDHVDETKKVIDKIMNKYRSIKSEKGGQS